MACAASDQPPVSAAVRFTYVLQEWPLYEWCQAPPDMDSYSGAQVGVADFSVLPFGACTDPVGDLQLAVMWPTLSEEMVVDGDVYSDLNPLQAPYWSAKVLMTNDPQCLLGDYLDEFLELCKNNKSTDQLLGKYIDNAQTEIDVSSALDKLADPAYNIPTIGNVVSKTTTVVTRATTRLQIKPDEAPIPTALLNEILVYLFPDAKDDFDKNKKADTISDAAVDVENVASSEKSDETSPDTQNHSKQDLSELQEVFRQFKSAPVNSLTHRLAVVMAVINHSYGGVRAVAHLWQEFVLEMRYRWENNYMITELEAGSPNMGCSLIHQKLQMLNCCIERKIARESGSETEENIDLNLSPDNQLETSSPLETVVSTAENNANIADENATNLAQSRDTELRDITDSVNKTSQQQKPEDKRTFKVNTPSLLQESAMMEEATKDTTDSKSDISGSSDEDEFFECEEEDDVTIAEADGTKSPPRKAMRSNSNSSSSSSKHKKEPQTNVDNQVETKTEPRDRGVLDSSISEPSVSTKPLTTHNQVSSSQSDSVVLQQQQQHDKGKNINYDVTTVASDQSLTLSQDGSRSLSETDGSFMEVYGHQAEGRLKRCDELKLLNNETEYVYIPVTQECAPMTEDTLDEHAEVLAKLGTSQEGMHLRARMQSASLFSDMQSFKAANPGATLGDFVRWYSPRDWIECEEDLDGTTVTKGQLSQRMQIPGNMWVEVWQSAKPIPARRQRRLFDDTKEAEKVLHWLASMKPRDVAMRLMPMLFHASIITLHQQQQITMATVKTVLKQIIDKTTKVLRAPQMELKRYEELNRLVGLAEIHITRAQSLQQKLGDEKQDGGTDNSCLQQFVSDLLEKPEVNIPSAANGAIGKIVHNLFKTAQKSVHMVGDDDMERSMSSADTLASRRVSTSAIPDFPLPAGKEYILRTVVPRPAPWSRPTPQRMYSIYMNNEFRLMGAFSMDTTFQ